MTGVSSSSLEEGIEYVLSCMLLYLAFSLGSMRGGETQKSRSADALRCRARGALHGELAVGNSSWEEGRVLARGGVSSMSTTTSAIVQGATKAQAATIRCCR